MTCLCLTRNRREWLPKAIRSYQAQTYTPRELLIVADGESIEDLVPHDDTTIRLIHAEEGQRVGQKRNFGCEHANGIFIAHFDDDDFSAPERLADQIGRLEGSGKAVTGYQSMYFTSGSEWWLYTGYQGFVLGTSLCYRKAWWKEHPFRALQVNEDGVFVSTASKHKELVTADRKEMMIATIHANNTSPRRLQGSNWRRARKEDVVFAPPL